MEASKAAQWLHLMIQESGLKTRLNHKIGVVAILDKWHRHRYRLQVMQLENKPQWFIIVTKLHAEWGAKPPGSDRDILLHVPLHHPDSINQVRDIIKKIRSNLT